MDPNEIIDAIVDAIDYAEIAKDMQGLVKARRLLNNDLRQAIDQCVQVEIDKTLQESAQAGATVYPVLIPAYRPGLRRSAVYNRTPHRHFPAASGSGGQ